MALIRILIADDHPLFRGALKQALIDAFETVQIDEVGTLQEIIEYLSEASAPDLVLLDLKMPGVEGFSGLLYLRAQYPDLPVVVVSATEAPNVIHNSLNVGASGFVPKSTPVEQIRDAIKQVLEGDIWAPDWLGEETEGEGEDIAARMASLTPQQVRVLMMLKEGKLNKQIAYELSVSEATIKAHVSAILQKLNVESRTQAVIAANSLDPAG